jgi:hypothetical protein
LKIGAYGQRPLADKCNAFAKSVGAAKTRICRTPNFVLYIDTVSGGEAGLETTAEIRPDSDGGEVNGVWIDRLTVY